MVILQYCHLRPCRFFLLRIGSSLDFWEFFDLSILCSQVCTSALTDFPELGGSFSDPGPEAVSNGSWSLY